MIILLAFATQASSKEKQTTDVQGKLFDKALKVWLPHTGDLDGTMVGKQSPRFVEPKGRLMSGRLPQSSQIERLMWPPTAATAATLECTVTDTSSQGKQKGTELLPGTSATMPPLAPATPLLAASKIQESKCKQREKEMLQLREKWTKSANQWTTRAERSKMLTTKAWAREWTAHVEEAMDTAEVVRAVVPWWKGVRVSSEKLEGVAKTCTEAVAAWERAADMMVVASTEKGPVVEAEAARAISKAAKATADAAQSEEASLRWTLAAVEWEAAAELIEKEAAAATGERLLQMLSLSSSPSPPPSLPSLRIPHHSLS